MHVCALAHHLSQLYFPDAVGIALQYCRQLPVSHSILPIIALEDNELPVKPPLSHQPVSFDIEGEGLHVFHHDITADEINACCCSPAEFSETPLVEKEEVRVIVVVAEDVRTEVYVLQDVAEGLLARRFPPCKPVQEHSPTA